MSNIVTKFLQSKQHERGVIEFYKDAFCVDGEVKVLKTTKGFKVLGIIELNDSKKGKFYIGSLEQEPTTEHKSGRQGE